MNNKTQLKIVLKTGEVLRSQSIKDLQKDTKEIINMFTGEHRKLQIKDNIDRVCESIGFNDFFGRELYKDDVIFDVSGGCNNNGEELPGVNFLILTGNPEMMFYSLEDGYSFDRNFCTSSLLGDISEINNNIQKYIKRID